MDGGLCLCPAHDDRTPSLSVRAGRTRLLFHCFAGCRPEDVLRALRSAGLVEPKSGAEPESAAQSPPGASLRSAAIRLWNQSGPIGGTAAQAYLSGRGIEALSRELRFHPRAPLGARPSTLFRPSMVAAVRDCTGLVAVHRTFLGESGSVIARRGLGRFGSGCVRLGPAAPRLGLAEGIETALSASALSGIPCWATLGSERFARIAVSAEVRELVLFLDNDSGGWRAEALARRSFAHLDIDARYPSHAGADWNDVLVSGTARRR